MYSNKENEEPPQSFLKNFFLFIKNKISKFFFKKKKNQISLTKEISNLIYENQNEIFGKNHYDNQSDNKSDVFEMMKDLILFYKIILDEIKIPRNKIISISQDEIFNIFEIFKANKISNIVVYGENLDNILGFINIKDLLEFSINEPECIKYPKNFYEKLKKLIRKPLFAPPTMKASNLLSKMKKDQIYLAIIIDEYGGTDGIITINDIISEIIGEIYDEDEEGNFIFHNENNESFEIDPLIPLDSLEEKIGEIKIDNLDFDDFETLNGLLISIGNKIPEINFEINLNENFTCKILEIDERSIKKVLIKKKIN